MKSKHQLKGILHAHSDLSHDGTLSPAELRSFFRLKGFDFLCISDHSQDLTPEKFRELKKSLQELSDAEFVFIPGIEYSCQGGVHILGIGIGEIVVETDPHKVIEQIHAEGGIAIWAHPTKAEYPSAREWIEKLDGIEIWNLASDGKFLPQTKSVNKYYELKRINPRLLAYFGMDFHRQERYYDLSLVMDGIPCNSREVFKALKAGRYLCNSGTIRLTSEPRLGWIGRMLMAILRGILNMVRLSRNRVTGE